MENEFKLTLENLFTIVRQEVFVCNPKVNYFYFGNMGNKGVYALSHKYPSIINGKVGYVCSLIFIKSVEITELEKYCINLNKQKFIRVVLICMCLHELGKNPYLREGGIFPDYLIDYLLKP